MKKILSSLTALAFAASALSAAVTISGTAATGGFLNNGDTGYLLIDTGTGGFDAGSIFASAIGGSIDADLDLTSGATYGTNIVVLSSSVVAPNFLSTPFIGFNETFDLGTNSIATNDAIALIIFDASAGTSVAGDTYRLYTGLGLVPGDGGTTTLSSATSLSTFGGTVATTLVPEPSSFALLAGCFGLAWVMVRRRS